MDAFESKLLRVLEMEPCLADRRILMVAISGGPDSVALLVGLCRLSSHLGVEIQAVHVNHGLRGQESEDDERFVADLCEALGTHLTVQRLEGATEGGGNLENRLRVRRYRLLEEAAAARRAVVATAHHGNDQAETLLLKLARGAGLTGLSGIYPRLEDREGRVRVIRPLLSFKRQDILDYLKRRRMQFRTDASNTSTQLDRNWVRRELLPRIVERLNPRSIEHLCQTATLAREAEELMRELSRAALPEVVRSRHQGSVELDLSRLSSRAVALRRYLIRDAVSDLSRGLTDLAFEQVESVLALPRMRPGHQVQLPGGLVAVRRYDTLVFKSDRPVGSFCYPLTIPGKCHIEALNKTICIEPCKSGFESSVTLRLERIPGDLAVRNRLPGDVFCTRSGRRRKLKKVLNDERIPHDLRDGLILLATTDAIIWVEKLWPHPAYQNEREPPLALWVRE